MLRINGIKLAGGPVAHERKPGKSEASAIVVHVKVQDGPAVSRHTVRFAPYKSGVKSVTDR